MPLNKRSQLETMQTVFILLFSFLIIIAAGFIFFSINVSKQKEKLDAYSEFSMHKKNFALALLPELICTNEGIIQTDCIDTLKISPFKESITDNDLYYKSYFGKIRLSFMIPQSGTNEEILIYDFKPEDYSSKKHYETPLIFYNYTTNERAFGWLSIDIYS